MPVITGAPLLISGATFSRPPQETIQLPVLIRPVSNSPQPFGPHRFGSSLYAVLCDSNNTPTIGQLGVFKKVAGVWARQDAGNEPPNDGATTLSFYYSPTEDGLIHILYRDAGTSDLHVIVFDCSTDTYGSPSTALTEPHVGTGGLRLYLQTGGDYYLYYAYRDAAARVAYRVLSGGVWSGETIVESIAIPGYTALLSGAIDEASGAMFLLYLTIVNTVTAASLRTVRVSGAGVVGTPGTVRTLGTLFVGDLYVDTNIGIIDTDRALFPVSDDSSNFLDLDVLIGTPLSAPVWAFSPVDLGTSLTGADYLDHPVLTITAAGNLAALWTVYETSTGDPDQLWLNEDALGSGTASLFYDAVANPPADGLTGNDQFIHSSGVIQLANGAWTFITAMEIDESPSPADDHCAGFDLSSEGSSPAPSCPVSPGGQGQVGVPFTATVTVAGGIPPYTFAIVGGALPPGLSLDPSTGVISGTPTTAGTYAYTIKVTGS